MRLFFKAYAPFLISILATTSAQATVAVAIDLSSQSMHVDSWSGSYDWPISSARSGFYTPGGSYAPTHMEVMHYSHKYHMSPMPHAIFFRGGYAIHGTYSTASLGHPASHGCIRLAPGNAATLFGLIKAEGGRIAITGTPPASASRVAQAERPMMHRLSEGPTTRRYRNDDADAPEGYRFIGRRDGHRVYQATQAPNQNFLGQLSPIDRLWHEGRALS